jgi:probable F420-dependent oxidoreductase
MARWGLTVPFTGISLKDHKEVLGEAERLGYTDAWSLEVDGTDVFTPLALASAWTERMRLGTAIASTFTRGPATLAGSALAMAEAAPGRFCLGLGASSDTIVRDWNGQAFDRPLARTRDVAALVREALTGTRVNRTLETASMTGFRLSRPVPAPVPIFLAALRGGMLRLAGETADGVIVNWLTPSDVPRVVGVARDAAKAAGRDPATLEVACRIFITMHDDREVARAAARRLIAAYLNVPVYRQFHQWLGNEPLLGAMWANWQAGDRRGALAAIPDEAVDALFATGDARRCRALVEAYIANGVETPILCFMPVATDLESQARESLAMLRALAP